jgi:hypothetical protein
MNRLVVVPFWAKLVLAFPVGKTEGTVDVCSWTI